MVMGESRLFKNIKKKKKKPWCLGDNLLVLIHLFTHNWTAHGCVPFWWLAPAWKFCWFSSWVRYVIVLVWTHQSMHTSNPVIRRLGRQHSPVGPNGNTNMALLIAAVSLTVIACEVYFACMNVNPIPLFFTAFKKEYAEKAADYLGSSSGRRWVWHWALGRSSVILKTHRMCLPTAFYLLYDQCWRLLWMDDY